MGKADTFGERLRRLPAGFLAALVLIGAVESLVGRGELLFRHDWAWDWHVARYRASRSSLVRDLDVLYLGDSLVKFNVRPEVVEGRTGLRGYNLASGAGPLTASYFRFVEALRAGGRPKAIVFDMVPHILAWNPGTSDKYCRPEVYSLAEGLDLARESGEPQFFLKLLARTYSPTLNFRDEVRSEVMRRLQVSGPSREAFRIEQARLWDQHRGAEPLSARAWGEQPPEWVNELRPEEYRVHPANRVYLRRMLAEARSRGIKAYLLLPPLDPDLQARFDREGADEPYLSFVREVRAEFPELVVLDARHSGYPREVHADPIHLDERGSAAFSASLGDVIASDPSGSSWVSMPAYDPSAAAIAARPDEGRAAR